VELPATATRRLKRLELGQATLAQGFSSACRREEHATAMLDPGRYSGTRHQYSLDINIQ
jgi:hypothetical protein